jgi:hypothetical protein
MERKVGLPGLHHLLQQGRETGVRGDLKPAEMGLQLWFNTSFRV